MLGNSITDATGCRRAGDRQSAFSKVANRIPGDDYPEKPRGMREKSARHARFDTFAAKIDRPEAPFDSAPGKVIADNLDYRDAGKAARINDRRVATSHNRTSCGLNPTIRFSRASIRGVPEIEVGIHWKYSQSSRRRAVQLSLRHACHILRAEHRLHASGFQRELIYASAP